MASEEVKSAARVLDLLELFDRLQVPLTLREIVVATGFPQSSTAALLATLIHKGYLAHDRRSHEYVPTSQVAHLGMWIGNDDVASEPALQRATAWLHKVTGETAVAAVRIGTYARYVIVQQRSRMTVVQTQAGVLRPICTSATGLALLSKLDDAAIRRTVARAQRERRGIVKHATLSWVLEQVANVRKHGFSVSRSGVFEGTGMIAAPLPFQVRGNDVALGIGGPLPRLDAKLSVIVRELRKKVNELHEPIDT